MLRVLLLACALACAPSPATAQSWQGLTQAYMDSLRPQKVKKAKPYKVKRARHVRRAQVRRARVSSGYGTVIGGRPAGCPRAYCGCASARYVGLRGAQWNLAANWLRLPRAAPAPGMAAARRGHVKIITAVLGDGRYRFYDPNSGGGATRITVGTLAGYQVVNPRGRS